jgi:hypothetical protein
LLSTAPVQSAEQLTRAKRLYHVVTDKEPASYVSVLLDEMSVKPVLLLVVEACHLYSTVPVSPLAAALLVKAAGLNGLVPLCAAAIVPPEDGGVHAGAEQDDTPPAVDAYTVLPETCIEVTTRLPKPLTSV